MRFDHLLILRYVKDGGKAIDLGCGSGELLSLLKREKNVNGIGVDIKEKKVSLCIEKGLSAIQEDIDHVIKEYRDDSFDYVILNDTLQTVDNPVDVLRGAVRIGKDVIVTFPNFAHYSIRYRLMMTGKMPKSENLPYEWHNTPNIHLFTIKDFIELSRKNGFRILESVFYDGGREMKGPGLLLPNLFAKNALFVIRNGGPRGRRAL